jgi:hypothetical protein
VTQSLVIHRDRLLARATLTGTGLPAITFTHLSALTIAVAFAADSTIAALGGTARCVLKESPTGDVLIRDTALAESGSGADTVYNAEWDDSAVDSTALRTFLAEATDSQSWTRRAWMEIEWTIGTATERVFFPVDVKAAFHLPEDDAPDPSADEALEWLSLNAIRYYPAITGLTGGGSTKLDGIATTALAVRSLVHVMREVDGLERLETWRLAAGTDAEDAAGGIIRPDDYHASTNAKVWKQLA